MRKGVFMALLCAFSLLSSAQNPRPGRLDSVQGLSEVVVVSQRLFRETIPSHQLSGELLQKLNSHSVADAMRYFSGLQIKDYGGVGGIKTVNIRSMGTHHLGIYYDGIELGNAQNGQIDLGQFSLDNVEEISLYNGQKSAILQPASDFGNAGSVYIKTRAPRFADGRKYNLKFKVKCGSSDMFRFSTLWEHRLSSAVTSSLSAGYLTSSGKYKFRYRRLNFDNSVAYDTTAIRQNGDIGAFRVEGNIHGSLRSGVWSLKAYTYRSERGIPGAIVNNVWRRGERQWDHNSFVQGNFLQNVGERFTTQLKAKYAYYRTRYVNNDTTQLLVDNTYGQQEFYVSTSNVYELLPNWSASASYDFKWHKLDADVREFVYPQRHSHFLSLATALSYKKLKMQASILGTFVQDRTRASRSAKHIHAFTPAVFVNVTPFRSKVFSLRAYAKKSFRMPTFNDLYYAEIGNSRLNPETALQYDAGFVLNKAWATGILRRFRLQFDGYFNTVHDKIVAYPKGQQFRWTMLNLGRVHITGIDVEAELESAPHKDLTLTGRLQYTYQDAKDVTNPANSYYRHQIPYIPWHSGSAVIGLSYKGWDLNYSFIYAGERYSQRENIRYNHMQPWYTNDLSLVYRFRWKQMQWRATLEVNNVFAQDYDVILNYPMPKRNYAISLDVNL